MCVENTSVNNSSSEVCQNMFDQVVFEADALSNCGTHNVQESVNHDKNHNVQINTIKESCIQSDVYESDNIVRLANYQINMNAEKNAVNVDAYSDLIIPIYDINYSSLDDKFVPAIMHAGRKNAFSDLENILTPIFHKWCGQVDFAFGFVPLQDQLLPDSEKITPCPKYSWLQIHNMVKSTGKPNFLEARFPVNSQLNVSAWERNLVNYWDRQLLELI